MTKNNIFRLPVVLALFVFLCLPALLKGQTVTGLAAAADFGQVRLYWDKYTNGVVTNYEIYWQTTPGVTLSSNVISTPDANVLSIHTGLNPGTTYYYAVRAMISGGQYTLLCPEQSATPLAMTNLFAGGNADGYSTNQSCFITLGGAGFTPAPANLNVAASLSKNVLYWDPMLGGLAYTVRWSNDPAFSTYTDRSGITNVSWVHDSLTPGLTYYYKVTAIITGICPVGFTNTDTAVPATMAHLTGSDGDGHTAILSCISDLQGTTVIPAPTNLAVAASLTGNVLYWDMMQGATTYSVRWSTSPTFASYTDVTGLTTLSWVHTGLAPGTTYYYKVTAAVPGGCPVGFSSVVSAIPVTEAFLSGASGDGHSVNLSCVIDLNGTGITPAPTNLVVAASLVKNVLYWDPMNGATSYTVRWSTNPGFTPYTDKTGITNISWAHDSLTPGSTYYYKVTAAMPGACPVGFTSPVSAVPAVQTHLTGADGDGHAANLSCLIDLDGASLTPGPTGLVTAASLNANVLYWDPFSGATSYTVRWSINPGFTPFTDQTGLTTLSWVHSPLTAGTTYYYKVTAVAPGGCPVGFSNSTSAVPVGESHLTGANGDGHSNYKSCTMDLNGNSVILTPTGLTVASSQISNVIFWDQNPDFTSYTLRWSTNSGFTTYTDVTGLTTISWVHAGINPGTTYYYKVAGVAGGGCPVNFTSSGNAIPVTAAYNTGGNGDGWSSSSSCFTMPLSGIDPVISPPGPVSICGGQTVTLQSTTGVTYQWIQNGSNISGANASTYTVTSAGTYVVQITNLNGCSAWSFPVVVNTGGLTVLSQPSNATSCVNQTATFTFNVSGGGLTYQWAESTNGGLSWTNLSNTPPYSGVTTATLTISPVGPGMNNNQYKCYILTPCAMTSNVATLTAGALAGVSLSNMPSKCINASPYTLSGGTPVGGTYSGNGVVGGIFYPAVAGIGQHSIIYTYTDGFGCSGSDTNTITVNPQPVVSLSAFPAVCDNGTAVHLTQGTPAGGSYSGLGVLFSYFYPNITHAGQHPVIYTYTDGNGCSAKDTGIVTVYSLPAVTLSSLASVCVNAAPVTLSGGSPSGGTYSGPGVNAGIFYPAIAQPGTHNIIYSYTDGNTCSSTDTSTITVYAQPAVNIPSFGPYCLNSAPVTLTGASPSGGVYSGTGVNTGIFYPAIAQPGQHSVMYSYTDGNGCAASDTTIVTVNTQPVVSLPAYADVCLTATPFALTGALPAGGTYTGVGVVGGTFNPAIAGTGTHNIYYHYTDGNGCSGNDTSTINVLIQPTVSIAAMPAVCLDATPLTLNSGSPSGGTYSGTGVAGGVFYPAIAQPGTHQIIYTYTNGLGCTGSDTASITVNSLPSANLTALPAVCLSAAPVTLSGGTPGGGTYSGTGVAGGVFYPAIAHAGTHAIIYTYTNGNNCSASDTATITVNALPVVSLPVYPDVCISAAPFSLTGALPSGGTYSGAGITGGTFSPAVAGTGTHNVYYHYTDGNACSNNDTSSITVHALPAVTISAMPDVCLNAAPFALTSGTPSGGTYSGAGINGGIFNAAVAQAGTHTVIYNFTDTYGCSGADTGTITVNGLPAVTMGLLSSVCVGASPFALSGGQPAGGTYSGPGVVGGIFYPAIAQAGTHAITYSYTGLNGCTGQATSFITVNSQATVSMAPLSPVCISAAPFALSGGTPAGGYYSGPGIAGGIFSPAVAQAGTHNVIYTHTNGFGCTGSDTTTITVYALPAVTLTTPAQVCANSAPVPLTGGSPFGGTYSGNGVNSGVFYPFLAPLGPNMVYYNYTDGYGCSSSDSSSINVISQIIVSIAAQNPVCIDAAPFALTGGTPSGGTYSGTGVVHDSLFPAIAQTGTHNIIYTYNDGFGCIGSDTATVTVNDVPLVSLAAFSPVCSNDAPFMLTGGSPAGGIYSGTGIAGGSFYPVNSNYGVNTVYYVYTDNHGCSANDTGSIFVNAAPVVSFSGLASLYCVNSASAQLTGIPAGGTFSGTGITGSTFDPAAAGPGTFNILYSYTDGNSCTSTDTITTTVDACTGIDAAAEDHAISVFPNPGNGLFNFILPGNTSYHISLFNELGELIFEDEPGAVKHYQLDQTGLSRGIYLIRFETEGHAENLRLIIQ